MECPGESRCLHPDGTAGDVPEECREAGLDLRGGHDTSLPAWPYRDRAIAHQQSLRFCSVRLTFKIQNTLLSVAIITIKRKKIFTHTTSATLNNVVNVEDSSSLVVLWFVLKGFFVFSLDTI